MENLVAFWKEKKVFLTGHTGFKGGWLALWLQYLGARLVGYALDPMIPRSFFEEAHVKDGMQDVRGDIGDFQKLLSALEKASSEIVFHLAAQPLVRLSYSSPLQTYQTNVMGTAFLLEAIRKIPSVKAVVIVTSDKCYENRESIWGYKEQDPLGGYDPYSASKACSELVTVSYRRSFFEGQIGIATARAGNVIGGGDFAEDRLIPDFVRAHQTKSPLRIRNPRSIRPWQHVLEPLYGYLLLAQKLYTHPTQYSEAWNFGPSEKHCHTVQSVIDICMQLWPHIPYQTEEPKHHETKMLTLDSSKAKEKLSWEPHLSFFTSLEMTLNWYQKSLRGLSMRAFSIEQIEKYMEQYVSKQILKRILHNQESMV